jgi:CRP/FNR family transcriptional regulator
MDSSYLPPVLAALPTQTRAELLRAGRARPFARDTLLHVAGDPPARVHLLMEGAVKLVARDAEGAEAITGLAFRGDLVGEAAMLKGTAQLVDAVGLTRGVALALPAAAFSSTLERHPAAALAVARGLARQVAWTEQAWIERDAAAVPGRLAGRLLALAELLGRASGGGVELDLPLGQRDLARLAGMCRESACKALRQLQRQGVLDYRGRRLRILRPDVLELLRCGAAELKP